MGHDNDGMIEWDMIMTGLIRKNGSIGANRLINRVYQWVVGVGSWSHTNEHTIRGSVAGQGY